MDGLEYAFDLNHVQWTANIISNIMATMIIPFRFDPMPLLSLIVSEMSTVMFGILDFASLPIGNRELNITIVG
jgi:hypothetical protein